MAETTVVTGHRMAFAVSASRSVLWDQIKYAGPPQDFSWVLPVRAGAFIETSRDAWFESLDSVTATRISPPQLKCASSSSTGCACGAMSAASDKGTSEGFAPGNGVTVVHEGTIGPYDTATLHSTNGDALTAWLESHGYVVPPDIAPTVAAYVSEGFDFIALRLSPGAGVNQMTPVRVVTPGPEGPLPLRMVAAGVGASVEITLYVIGEGRFSLPDLHEVTLDQAALSWDFSSATSNYADLRKKALAKNLGFSYLTTFAEQGAFSKSYTDADNLSIFYQVAAPAASPQRGTQSLTTFADLYFAQALANDNLTTACPSVLSSLQSSSLVQQTPSAASLGSSVFTCGAYDDISAAMIGMHPAATWLTRFDLDLPREALSADCVVSLHEDQVRVEHALLAPKFTNRPSSCVEPLFESKLIGGSERGELAWLAVLGLMAITRLRRRGTSN